MNNTLSPTQSYNLEHMRRLIVVQANFKKWNTSEDYMIKRASEEIKELDEALNDNRISPEDTAKEGIDIIYFVVQALDKKCKNINLNQMFIEKFNDNDIKKKKTIDENGKPVRR